MANTGCTSTWSDPDSDDSMYYEKDSIFKDRLLNYSAYIVQLHNPLLLGLAQPSNEYCSQRLLDIQATIYTLHYGYYIQHVQYRHHTVPGGLFFNCAETKKFDHPPLNDNVCTTVRSQLWPTLYVLCAPAATQTWDTPQSAPLLLHKTDAAMKIYWYRYDVCFLSTKRAA